MCCKYFLVYNKINSIVCSVYDGNLLKPRTVICYHSILLGRDHFVEFTSLVYISNYNGLNLFERIKTESIQNIENGFTTDSAHSFINTARIICSSIHIMHLIISHMYSVRMTFDVFFCSTEFIQYCQMNSLLSNVFNIHLEMKNK
jgi:hypothetical protein